MSVINSQPLIGASGQAGYNLTKSLRFRSSASAYLNRTPASAGNRKTWTWSGWVKRGTLGVSQYFFSGGTGGGDTTQTGINFLADDRLNWLGGSGTQYRTTTQVFRDPSAWYHIVLAFDTTLATANDRIKIYVNGTQITAFDNLTNPTQNVDYGVNQAEAHNIGRWTGASGYFDGYLAEVNFIDGQALTPSSFGETSTTTGVWIPKKYTGTYGTNGFYLPFTDTTSTSTLGTDFSGNSNTWTVNNISLTSGSTYDSMTDVPTLTNATVANYCTLNPLDASTTAIASNGNLKVTNSSSANTGHSGIFCTQAFPTNGLFYYEIKIDSFATASAGGFVLNGASKDTDFSSSTNLYQYSVNSGVAYANGTTAYTGSTLTTGDILGVAVDMTNGALYFAKNNTWQNSGVPTSGASKTGAISFTVANNILPACYVWKSGGGDALSANFGQQPFSYTPPTGFVALNTFNLPTPTIGATASTTANKYFNAITYTGNGAASSNTTQNITTTFYPDLTWVKGRDSAFFHRLTSTGLTQPNYLSTNSTDAEGSVNDTISALASTYFQVKAAGTGGTNQSGSAYVGWTWNANSGSTASNTAGSITSTVSANTTAGFSIVTYTGNGTAGATIGHGLGVAPSMAIIKMRSAVQNWTVYHASLGNTKALSLDLTDAASTTALFWNNTSPTSSLITLGSGNGVNKNTETYVAYCFAQVAGYSAFGSYTGNGATDGTFVYTGFRPKFVMIKCSSSDQGGNAVWVMLDTARNTYNVTNNRLKADSSTAEDTSPWLDINSNGFKIRETSTSVNGSSATYIYMAFAESPFKYANAR